MRWIALGVFLYLLFYTEQKEGNMLTKKREKIPVGEAQARILDVYKQRMESLKEYINWLPPGEHFSQRIKDFLLITEQRFPIKLPLIQTNKLSVYTPEVLQINKYQDKIEKLEELLEQNLTIDREQIEEILE